MRPRQVRPIQPAPPTRPRYPRVGVVWRAFAAGGLSAVLGPSIARAECSLPTAKESDHGAFLPSAIGGKKNGKKATPMPRPQLPGKLMSTLPVPGTRIPVSPPSERRLGGVVASVEPPPLAPRGEPARVVPPPPPGRSAPAKPATTPTQKPEPVHVDGDVAHV